MLLNRKISVKLHTLILATAAPVIAILMINGNPITTARSCGRKIESPNHEDHVRIDNVLNYTVSSVIENPSNMKTILYWTESDDMDFGDGTEIFASCPVRKCIATRNRTALNVEDFDAILFNPQDMNKDDLPPQRSPHQRYIFHNIESQIHRPISDDLIYRNFFNWTMTYRRDSTLMRPRGVFKVTDTKEYIPPHIPILWKDVSNGKIEEKTRKIVEGKTKLISWFVSEDCVTSSKREVYVKALKQHIPIDIFGKCGTLECDEEGVNCFDMVEKKYYFHLAVENSLCVDYVTEDLFKLLQYNIVPVVYGAADYVTMLPPGSYIDIRDFADPKKLADHLWAVSQDPELYLSFFKWKNYFEVQVEPEYYTVCELCKKLYETNRRPVVVEDIYGWWTNAQCLRKPSFKGISQNNY